MSDHKNNTDASLSDPHTFQGKTKPKMDDVDTRSLGDQATFAGGRPPANPKSYGDDVTYGGGVDPRDDEDDGMEVVDLAARYKIEKILGKGGMGEVLLATDTRLNRKVAIKRILGDSARSRTAVTRFLKEAKSIAALNHPSPMDGAGNVYNDVRIEHPVGQSPVSVERMFVIELDNCVSVCLRHKSTSYGIFFRKWG